MTSRTDSRNSTDEPIEASNSSLFTVRVVATIVLAVLFFASLGGAVYIASTPQQTTEPYTEFYVLDADGKAADYPTNLTTGERAEVIIGVTNHEHVGMTYTLVVSTENRTINNNTISVGRGEQWEETITYSIEYSGTVSVDFLLYRGTDTTGNPYRSLRLWTTVTEPSRTNATTDIGGLGLPK